jgi:class 3 adenylate cyclase
MTNIIESYGGFVDKYIGDAVIGVFGAPLKDPDHAQHAVEAALDCQRRLALMQETFGLPGNPEIVTRIGINTGQMLVGNIGSARRFNYTVMGDAVNLAARLESANKLLGTTILVSDTTRDLCGGNIFFREIDRIRVVGRDTPATVYQPMDTAGDQDRLQQFDLALSVYRTGNFAEAEVAFRHLAESGDPVAAKFRGRAEDLRKNPPEEWKGVTDLDSK